MSRLSLEGHLELMVPGGRTITVDADGNRVLVEIGDVPIGRYSGLRSRLALARRLAPRLARAGLTVSVTRGGRTRFEAGDGISAPFFARLLGFRFLRVHR